MFHILAQRREGAAHVVQVGTTFANQDFLGDANAWQSGHHAEMCGDAKPARVRDAMAIEEGEVWFLRQSF